MALTNMLLLTQIAGYSVSIVLCFCVVIPLFVNLKDFKGHCLLYSGGNFLETGSFVPHWASRIYCMFTIILAMVLTVVSIIQLVRMSRLFHQGADSSFLSAFWDSIIALFSVLLTLTDAIFVTSGFATWCSAVTKRFTSCQAAAIMNFDSEASSIDPANFFIQMGTVQFGVWACFVTWVLLLVLAGRKLFIYHERENLIISMYRERRRYTTQGYNDLDR